MRRSDSRPRRCRGHHLRATAPADVEEESVSTSGTTEIELQGRSFRVLQLEGCEYLIHTDSAGRLTLQDCFVHDLETDIYAEPTFSGRMPDAPMRYAEVPWIVQFFGDRVYNKAPWQRVERIYLVAIREPDDIAEFSLNLDDVFILDRETRDIKRGQVIWNKNITADTDPTTLTLRIRKDGLYMDRFEDMPDIEDLVSEAELAGWEAEQRKARDKSAASVASLVGGGKDEGGGDVAQQSADADEEPEPQDPIDAMSDEDFDGPEDTPAVDLGF
ncbi:g6026 [Coccomyxa elongata]